MKNYDEYVAQRLTAEEIKEDRREAHLKVLEIKAIEAIQQSIAQRVNDYMQEEQLNPSDFKILTGFSSTQINKIRQGKANLTIKSLVHLMTKLGYSPLKFLETYSR